MHHGAFFYQYSVIRQPPNKKSIFFVIKIYLLKKNTELSLPFCAYTHTVALKARKLINNTI